MEKPHITITLAITGNDPLVFGFGGYTPIK